MLRNRDARYLPSLEHSGSRIHESEFRATPCSSGGPGLADSLAQLLQLDFTPRGCAASPICTNSQSLRSGPRHRGMSRSSVPQLAAYCLRADRSYTLARSRRGSMDRPCKESRGPSAVRQCRAVRDAAVDREPRLFPSRKSVSAFQNPTGPTRTARKDPGPPGRAFSPCRQDRRQQPRCSVSTVENTGQGFPQS